MTRRQWWGTAAALLVLGAAAAMAAHSASAIGRETGRQAGADREAGAARAGMRVFIDPATGEFIDPTPEEIQSLEQGVAGMLGPEEDLEVVELPDGSLTVDLEERFLEVAIATVAPGGELRTGCVNHPGQVKEILSRRPDGHANEPADRPAAANAPLEVR